VEAFLTALPAVQLAGMHSGGRVRREALGQSEMAALTHGWPGNVREPLNLVERAIIV
jgi:DNA-binding NtrC family response regulator